MTKRTRLKIAVSLLVFLGLVVLYSLFTEAYGITGQALTGIMLIGPTYILGDSYRKSNK